MQVFYIVQFPTHINFLLLSHIQDTSHKSRTSTGMAMEREDGSTSDTDDSLSVCYCLHILCVILKLSASHNTSSINLDAST